MRRSVARLNATAERPRRRTAASVDNFVYLTAVGIVATAIAGVFFTAGFLLLGPPAGGKISSSNPLVPGPQDRWLSPDNSPLSGGVLRLADTTLGAAPVTPLVFAPRKARALTSILPAPSPPPSVDQAPAMAATEALPDEASPVAELRAEQSLDASVKSEPAPASPPISASAPAPPGLRLSAAEISNLLEHGDALLRSADLTSARLFYERAAAAGDGRAALRLGATFDPAFLERAGLRNVKGDAAEARLWYGRALDLGTAEAKQQLNGVETNKGDRFQ